MKLTEINIRDPFIITHEGKYYMYGTRAAECWGKRPATGLDVYVSTDLDEWTGPHLAFEPPADFWADRNFWAPEVHKYKDRFYMFVSFKSESRHRGTQILAADSPMGPFLPHSPEPITPADWECLDGTFYLDKNGVPYMIFCHEWTQVRDGEICAVRLTDDLTAPAGEPWLLFRASEAEWIKSVTGNDGDYVTDGPFMYRARDGKLYMLWSGDNTDGYAEALAVSSNGDIDGKWSQAGLLVHGFPGGHGMIFTTLEGERKFTMHAPDRTPHERPLIFDLDETGDTPRAAGNGIAAF